jgi:hypothetical protein
MAAAQYGRGRVTTAHRFAPHENQYRNVIRGGETTFTLHVNMATPSYLVAKFVSPHQNNTTRSAIHLRPRQADCTRLHRLNIVRITHTDVQLGDQELATARNA